MNFIIIGILLIVFIILFLKSNDNNNTHTICDNDGRGGTLCKVYDSNNKFIRQYQEGFAL